MLALPLVATSLSAAAFQIVDLAFVSRLGDAATTAVVVTNQSVRQLLFMVVLGLGFGAQALVSQRMGAGQVEEAGRVAGQVLLLGGGLSLAIAGLGLVAAEPILRFMRVSPETLAVGVPYVRLVLVLASGIVFGMLFNALLHGAGDATTPMLLTGVQTGVSLVAEWCLIFGHGGLPALGISGVALGAFVGQAVAAVLMVRVLGGRGARLRLRGRHLRPDPALLGRIVRTAWPPALQMVSGFLVTVVFLRMTGSFGGEAQAAYSIGLRLSMMGPMLAFPLAGACATLVGQNLGAGRVDRAWRAVGIGIALGVALLWTIAAGMFVFRHALVAAFATSPEVRRIGSELLAYQAGAFLAWAIYFPCLRALQGAGDVRVPMLISLANALLLTLPLGTWLATEDGLGRGPTGIFQAQLVGAVTVTLATGAWLLGGRWTRAAPRRAEAGAP